MKPTTLRIETRAQLVALSTALAQFVENTEEELLDSRRERDELAAARGLSDRVDTMLADREEVQR